MNDSLDAAAAAASCFFYSVGQMLDLCSTGENCSNLSFQNFRDEGGGALLLIGDLVVASAV
jgi:hypothetical protein